MTRRRSMVWRWSDGLYLPDPGFAGFVRATLADPYDDNTRLAFADRVQEVATPGAEEVAGKIRASGRWEIGGANGRRSYGLVRWPVASDGVISGAGSVVALIRRDQCPACQTCGTVPAYSPHSLLLPRPGGWRCLECNYAILHG